MAGIKPNAVVIVATVRALKMHGGVEVDALGEENVDALLKGTANLEKHVESIQAFGVPFVIAINKFAKDTKAEVEALLNWCKEKNYPESILNYMGNILLVGINYDKVRKEHTCRIETYGKN